MIPLISRVRDDVRERFDPMAKYQLYLLDSSDRVASAQFLECENDDAARALVQTYVRCGIGAELWQETRLIECYELERKKG